MTLLWTIAALTFVLLAFTAFLSGWGGFIVVMIIPVVIGIAMLWTLLVGTVRRLGR